MAYALDTLINFCFIGLALVMAIDFATGLHAL